MRDRTTTTMILITAATILITTTITSILMGSTIKAQNPLQRDQQPVVTRYRTLQCQYQLRMQY